MNQKIHTDNIQTADYKTGKYKVVSDIVSVRKGAGKCFAAKKFEQLSPSAQAEIIRLKGNRVNGFVKQMEFAVLSVKYSDSLFWGETDSGWISLNNCEFITN